MAFSRDGNRLAYGIKTGNKRRAVPDGEIGPEHDYVGNFLFSPDNKRFTYAAGKQDSKNQSVVVDGQLGPEYDKVPFKLTVTNDTVEYLAERHGWVLRCRRPF
jgi:hypothetical protein